MGMARGGVVGWVVVGWVWVGGRVGWWWGRGGWG